MGFKLLRNTQRVSRRGSSVVERVQPRDHDERLEREIESLPRSPEPTIYASILCRCKVLSLGKRLHDHISGSRYRSNTFLNNMLIHMYGACGSIDDASSVFDSIKQRNIYSWNIMLVAYAQNGHLLRCCEFFQKLPLRDISSWTAMISTYSREGCLQQARAVFDQISEPDITAWNAMISSYAQTGHPRQACELFQRADIEGAGVQDVTLICTLDACDDLHLGMMIHREAEDSGLLEINTTLGTALVTMYARCRDLSLAVETFIRMPGRNDVSWSALTSALAQNDRLEDAIEAYTRTPHLSTIAVNTMISALLQSGRLEEAKSLFEGMSERDAVSWNAMLSGYTHAGEMQLAMEFFRGMPKKSTSSWNTMIAAFIQNGFAKESIGLFKEMDLEGFKPDAMTYPSVFEACGFISGLKLGRIVHSQFRASGFLLDEFVGTSLINMYGSCGSLVEAEDVFQTMPRRNVVVWNSMIAVYDQNGLGQRALDKFQDMELEGELPDRITFITALAACSHVGRAENCRRFFFSMIGDYGIQPVLDHYMCVMDFFGRSGRLHEAEDLLENMPFIPDDVAWTTLLASSRVLGDFKKSSVAADRASRMDPGDSSFYVLLSNVYTSSSQPEQELI